MESETIPYDSDQIKASVKARLRERLEGVQSAVEEALEAMDAIDDAEDPGDRSDARSEAIGGVESVFFAAAELRVFCEETLRADG